MMHCYFLWISQIWHCLFPRICQPNCFSDLPHVSVRSLKIVSFLTLQIQQLTVSLPGYAMVTMHQSNEHGRWDVSNHWQADRRLSNVTSTICRCVFTQARLNSLEQSNAAECPAHVMNDSHSILLPSGYSCQSMCVYIRVYQQSEDTRHGSQSSHTTDTDYNQRAVLVTKHINITQVSLAIC